MKYFIIGLGGAMGAVGRYLLQGLVHQFTGISFPYGTLVVNILGCFLIGFIMELSENRFIIDPQTRLFITVGILGGFTTFSSFGYETFSLLRDGETLRAILNVTLSMVVGLGAVWFGFITARLL
jgi:CrcB protein